MQQRALRGVWGVRPYLHALVVLCWVQQWAEGRAARCLAFGHARVWQVPMRRQAHGFWVDVSTRVPIIARSQVTLPLSGPPFLSPEHLSFWHLVYPHACMLAMCRFRRAVLRLCT